MHGGVGKIKTASELWTKVQSKYMIKTTTSFLLKQFFSFKMDTSINLDEKFKRFTKLVQDIVNIDKKKTLSKYYMATILLNFVNDRHKDIKVLLGYGREELTIDNFFAKEKVLSRSNNHSKYFNKNKKKVER